MTRLLTAGAYVAAAAVLLFAFGVIVGNILHVTQHRHATDPDLSAYVGVPACPCGSFAFDWDTL